MKAEVRDQFTSEDPIKILAISTEEHFVTTFHGCTGGNYKIFDCTKAELRQIARVCLQAAREMK